MDVVLIPAYKPDKELLHVVDELKDLGFALVVVNDGSGEDYKEIFEAVSTKAHLVVLEKNRGKGGALKAGMAYIRDHLPECTAFITCDADGQHRAADVLRVKQLLDKGEKFVLTVRQRKGKIPLRSRFGNDLSKFVYTLLTNRYLSDNQSGLRGFHISNLDWMIQVERDKYDYEMNVLYYAAKMGIKVTTMPIDAIYIENNASSHFNPILDTYRIYRSLFALARGTLFSVIVAELAVLLADILFGSQYALFIVPIVGAVQLLTVTLLNKFLFLRQLLHREHFTTVSYTIISYFIYTLMCVIVQQVFPQLPLFLIFNGVLLICLPLRYFMHQLLFIAALTKEESRK